MSCLMEQRGEKAVEEGGRSPPKAAKKIINALNEVRNGLSRSVLEKLSPTARIHILEVGSNLKDCTDISAIPLV